MHKVLRRYRQSRWHRYYKVARKGYIEYSWLFYITTIGTLLTAVIGVAGPVSILAAFAMFYYLGKFKLHIEG